MHAPTAVLSAAAIADACLPLLRAAEKPVLTCWLGGSSVIEARRAMTDAHIASYRTPERGVAAWLQRVSYARNQESLLQLPSELPGGLHADVGAARQMI